MSCAVHAVKAEHNQDGVDVHHTAGGQTLAWAMPRDMALPWICADRTACASQRSLSVSSPLVDPDAKGMWVCLCLPLDPGAPTQLRARPLPSVPQARAPAPREASWTNTHRPHPQEPVLQVCLLATAANYLIAASSVLQALCEAQS